jgi:hypothetical protein
MGLIWTPTGGTGLSGTGADPANSLTGMAPSLTGSSPRSTLIGLGITAQNTPNGFAPGDPFVAPKIAGLLPDSGGLMPDQGSYSETLTSWFGLSQVNYDGTGAPTVVKFGDLMIACGDLATMIASINSSGGVVWYTKPGTPDRFVFKIEIGVYDFDANNNATLSIKNYFLDYTAPLPMGP